MNPTVVFDRWKHVQNHTWPFQMYKQYDLELSNYFWTEYSAHKHIKDFIDKETSSDDADSRSYFSFPGDTWNVPTMREWKEAYDEELNFLYLSCVMAMSSNLETFMDAIISLAIESNPGVLTNRPKSIDGTKLLKHSPMSKRRYKNMVNQCIEGTWMKRRNAIKSIFGSYPSVLDTHISTLEAIRKMRNRIGHAFGRDIQKARTFSSLNKEPAERISLVTLRRWLGVSYDVAEAMDAFLLDNSIGEYQIILAYHNHQEELSKLLYKEKARRIKKMYGGIDQQVGLLFCEGLIDYYNSL